MATTHRPNDRGFAPEFEFQVVLDVLEISEVLAARRRSITPDAIARRLSDRPSGSRPTLAQIKGALAQVRLWRTQILTRDLLQHRRQIVELYARIEAEQHRLSEDAAYLMVMLRETDTILQNTLTAPGGADALSAPASAREPRPLQ